MEVYCKFDPTRKIKCPKICPFYFDSAFLVEQVSVETGKPVSFVNSAQRVFSQTGSGIDVHTTTMSSPIHHHLCKNKPVQ